MFLLIAGLSPLGHFQSETESPAGHSDPCFAIRSNKHQSYLFQVVVLIINHFEAVNVDLPAAGQQSLLSVSQAPRAGSFAAVVWSYKTQKNFNKRKNFMILQRKKMFILLKLLHNSKQNNFCGNLHHSHRVDENVHLFTAFHCLCI